MFLFLTVSCRSLLLSFPPLPPDLPDIPFWAQLANLLPIAPIEAAANGPPPNLSLNPNISFTNFSAGISIAKHANPYNILLFASSTAEPHNTVYNNKWNGCTSTLYINSVSHLLKACAFPSEILSIGYVIHDIGPNSIKKIIVNSLFKYFHANKNVIAIIAASNNSYAYASSNVYVLSSSGFPLL